MKPVLFFAALLACCFNSFSQESEPRVRRYVTRPLRTSSELTPKATVATIPTWTASADGYTYEMVGQNPAVAQSNPTTNLAVPVIPVVLTFSDGTVFDPGAADASCSAQGTPLSLMLSSPIFNSHNYTPGGTGVGNTLYHDFFQRANFWQYTNPNGINPNFHILLNGSAATALKISVPSSDGKTVSAKCGRMGEMEINWFDNYLQTTGFKQLAAAGVPLASVPVFMMYNVVMYDSTVSDCCILGYHSALNNPNYSNGLQTYAVTDFDTTGDFGVTLDVSSLSHEMAELIDDPTGNNPTPAWGNVGQVTGCQTNLEVGDPLSGTDITIPMSNGYTYHVQELAFLSWFYRQSPSIGVNGWYSSNGTFRTPASACSSSTTTLSISPTTIPAGGSAAVSVKVSAPRNSSASGTPTGTVTLVSAATGATLETWTLTGGAVSATVSNLPSGSYSVTADYSGDSTFSPSKSAEVTLNVGAGTVSFSPVSLSFGTQALNTATAAQTVTLTNKGTAALANIAVSITGASPGDYSQTNNCPSSLAVNANCAISVTFKPTASGLRTAAISVSDNAAGSPQTVSLSGTGAGSGTGTASVSPSSLSFGNENVGSASAAQTITLSNTGAAPLTISSIQLTGANPNDFPSTTNCGRSLAAGSSCTVTVTFKPAVAGSRTAAIAFTDGTAASTQSVPLSGTGVSTGTPALTLSTASLTFGNQPQNSQSAAQSVTLTNSGSGALSISAISLGGVDPQDFTGTTNCPSSLGAGSSCTVTLRFRPLGIGALTATLTITDNVAGSPQSVALSGTGTAASPHTR